MNVKSRNHVETVPRPVSRSNSVEHDAIKSAAIVLTGQLIFQVVAPDQKTLTWWMSPRLRLDFILLFTTNNRFYLSRVEGRKLKNRKLSINSTIPFLAAKKTRKTETITSRASRTTVQWTRFISRWRCRRRVINDCNLTNYAKYQVLVGKIFHWIKLNNAKFYFE